MNIIYGIKNCSTVQKAIKFLDDNNIEFTFHDYKKLRIDKEHLEEWCNQLTWQKVLNRLGMMWRKVSEEEKLKVVDQRSAIDFMLSVPTSIKRPILENDKKLLAGFVESEYQDLYN